MEIKELSNLDLECKFLVALDNTRSKPSIEKRQQLTDLFMEMTNRANKKNNPSTTHDQLMGVTKTLNKAVSLLKIVDHGLVNEALQQSTLILISEFLEQFKEVN